MTEILTIIGLSIVGLCILCSGVWWMASLYGLVKSNGKAITKMSIALTGINTAVQDHAKECDSDRAVAANTLQLTESNMTIMNGQLKDHDRRIVQTSQKLKDHIEQHKD